MALKNLYTKLNWRFCLIHFLAAYLLTYAFYFFAYLAYSDIIQSIVDHSKLNPAIAGEEISGVFVKIDLITGLGLLIALTISLLITFRAKIWWANSLIVFVTAAFLQEVDLLGWQYTKYIFTYTIGWIDNYIIRYLLSILLLLGISLFLYFSKTTNSFIARHSKPVIAPTP